MDKKIINFQDKKNKLINKTNEEYIKYAVDDLYWYIQYKVRASFSLLIVLDEKNLEFLSSVEDEELLLIMITKECVNRAIDIAFNNEPHNLIELDSAIDEYLINNVMVRLEDWYNETINK